MFYFVINVESLIQCLDREMCIDLESGESRVLLASEVHHLSVFIRVILQPALLGRSSETGQIFLCIVIVKHCNC